MNDTTPAMILLRDILERFPQADPESEFYNEEIDGCDAVNYLSKIIPEIRTLLDADPIPTPDNSALEVLRAAWFFIEDVTDDDTNLENVDTIEIAGCTDADGIVDVINETDAEFFSTYTHRQGEGVECICDFNSKAQAVEFAKALAIRGGISVIGNLCAIE